MIASTEPRVVSPGARGRSACRSAAAAPAGARNTPPTKDGFSGVTLVLTLLGVSRYDTTGVIDDPHQPRIGDVVGPAVGARLVDPLKE